MDKSKTQETWGDIYSYVDKRLAEGVTDIVDWRPASDMYIDDLVKVAPYNNQMFVTIPMGVRLWLENGDSIIYIKKNEKEKKHNG